MQRAFQAFEPERGETFAAPGDERENRAVRDQVHDGQNEQRFENSGFLQIGLAKAGFAPVRDQMKSGRPAEQRQKRARVEIEEIRDDDGEKRNRRKKIRRERDPCLPGRAATDLANLAAFVRADADSDRKLEK
jgi:hypothetical protein